MNRGFSLLLAALLLSLTCFAHSQVRYGTLSVKDNHRLESRPIYLSGTWQLYIGKMLATAEDVWIQPPDAYITVPGTWNSLLRRHGHSADAVCTYRMYIEKLKPSHKYALYMKDSPKTAANVYCNGRMARSIGTVREDPAESCAGRQPFYAEAFSDSQGNMELVFQIASHDYREGGITDVIRFGEAECVYKEFCYAVAGRLYICANLLVLVLYNFMLFLINRKNKSTLFFALFVLITSVRMFTADCPVLTLIFPGMPFGALCRTEYFTLWAGMPLFVLFCREEFPAFRYWNAVFAAVCAIGLILGCCCTFLPMRIANKFAQGLLVYSVGTMMSMLVIMLPALKYRSRKIIILFSEIFILFAAGVSDIIIARYRIIFPIMAMPYAMMIFAVFQFGCISLEQSRMFARHKTLVAELEKLNEACVRFVPKEFLQLLHVKDMLKDVYLGNHVDVEMCIAFSQMYFEPYDGCREIGEEEKMQVLSSFFHKVSLQIAGCRGFVSKFISYGFMALFPRDPEDAIECSENIVRAVDELNKQRRKEGRCLLRIGIGIHYGRMILGMIGEEHRLDDTVISDTVNTASRIESYAEKQKLSVVVSETVVSKTPQTDKGRYYPLGEIKVKGKTMPLLLSEYRV